VEKPGLLLESEGRVEIEVPGAPALSGSTKEAPELPVLFEDEHLLVVDKPAGLLTHSTASRPELSVASIVAARFGALPTLYGEERPGIVHRLDRDTSGILLLGRTLPVLEALKAAFQAREVAKTYLAIVRGDPRFDTEWVDARLGRAEGHRDRISVVGEGEGRDAATYYEVRERFVGFALLAVFPKTGRTHQVRVHLASIGLPLLGEELYVPRGTRGESKRHGGPLISRQALHAQVLELAHPVTGERLRFEAPVPEDMRAALEALRGRRGS
jgi:23S rRNA pseudouridine1911/1915/1917 synthase